MWFEKKSLHLHFEDYCVHWPDDEYHQLKGTAICFRVL